MISLTLALILAILAPLIWASINILDKYVSSHKVKNPLSFTFLAGLVNLLAGILIALFINWNYPFSSLLAPAITGILFGTQYYFWYFIYKHEDASHLIGLIYLYPLVVALLSFIFIKEILSISSYFGLGFILIGVLVLSLRLKQIKLKASLWMIIMAIFVTALYEFLAKIAVTNLPPSNAVAISLIFLGLTTSLVIFHKKSRIKLKKEIANYKWAILNEGLTIIATFALFLPLTRLPVTFVAAVASIQPLIVLYLEKSFNKSLNIVRDKDYLRKLIALLLIVLGVILLYIPEIIKLL